MKAALERFLEIVSEVSRHIPLELKAKSPQVSWRRVADIGNHLRHAYQHVDVDILWDIYVEGELARLRGAVAGFIRTIDVPENS